MTSRIFRSCLIGLLLLGCHARISAQPAPALPQGTEVHKDLAYVDKGHERQKLDLYLPESAGKAPKPLIVWIHGGAWRAGSKDRCPALRFLEMDYAVASLNYRLSQHAIFPAQIEDCKAAIRWLRAHAAAYRLDPDRIGVWGSSAGGHLAALLGTASDDKTFEVGAHLDFSSRVQAVCDFFGPTDFAQMNRYESRINHDAADSPESHLIGGPIQEHRQKTARANPITYVSKSDPPFLILHGDKDPLVPMNQSELLHDALKKAGVEVAFHVVQGAGHGFSGDEIDRMVKEFFERHLQKRNPAKAKN